MTNILPQIPGAEGYLELLRQQLDLVFLEGIEVQHLNIRESGRGLRIDLALAFPGELALALPEFDLLSLVLGDNLPGYTFISASLYLEDPARLELHKLQGSLRIEHPLLVPVSMTPGQPAPAHFAITVSGALSLDSRLNIRPALGGFNVPPFMIGETGLVLTLEDCRPVLSTLESPQPVIDLGFDESFRGIYARRGLLEWRLPQTVLNDGVLGVNLENAALGDAGVSLDVDVAWAVEASNGHLTNNSEMLGHLFDPGFELALARLHGQVRRNVPQAFSADGLLRIPMLGIAVEAAFGLRALNGGAFATHLRLAKAGDQPLSLSVAGGTLHVERLEISGALDDQGVDLEGHLGGRLSVPGLSVDLELASVNYHHHEDLDELSIHAEGLRLGPLGEVEQALLKVAYNTDATTGQDALTLLVESQLSWQDLESRLPMLADLPAEFPRPPEEGQVTARLHWENNTLNLRFTIALENPDHLWPFIPQAFRPEVRQFDFTFQARSQTESEFSGSSTADSLQGEIKARMELRPPQLPGMPGADLIRIYSGDTSGWIRAEIKAGLRPDPSGSGNQPYMEMALENPVAVDLQLPGLPQPAAPIHTSVTSVEFDLTTGADVAGRLHLVGGFALRPLEPPDNMPMASHLRTLMSNVGIADLAGSAEFTIAFTDDRAALQLECTLNDAMIEIDVFAMIAALAAGLEPAGEVVDVPLDMDVGFGLRGVSFTLGALDDSVPASQFSLKMVTRFRFAGLSVDSFFELSDQAFALGVERMEIPLEIPRFPLDVSHLDPIRRDSSDPDSPWDPGAWGRHLDDMAARITHLRSLDDPAVEAELRVLEGRRFLLENLKNIYELLSGPTNHALLQAYTEMLLEAFSAVTGLFHVNSDLLLVMEDVQFRIPFADPRAIGLSGTAHLEGFADDDPFKALEGVTMGLGLTSDQIFFSLESLGAPIPLPDFGRYPGGEIVLSRLRIGYGYTKNSFSMTFAGALRLPDQLVADADTSDLIGAGIRLPTHNSLSFKLDLIPVVLGAVDFIVPLFEFDLDLRAPTSRALVSTQVCEPYWDGLQIIVPGLYHDSLKHLAFSPMFSMFVMPNLRFDGDIMLGNPQNGFTVIVNNLLVLFGYFSGTVPVPVPFFASPHEPYFDNLCVNLRLAGFGINFNLQRPFPSFSPLALFEVLGLLSDPTMPIDPKGSLANTIRISLNDAYITLPSALLRLFPEAGNVVKKELNLTLNLGTLITAVQALAGPVNEIAGAMEDSTKEVAERLEALVQNAPDLSLGNLLALVPPELRKLRLSGAFAGFEATAMLLLMDANDRDAMKREFSRRDASAASTPSQPSLEPGQYPDAEELSRFRPNLEPRPNNGRVIYTDDPANNLFKGTEFAAFDSGDLDDLPPPRKPMAGVMVGAHVKIFEGQRFRFIGALFEDGSFSLISALDIDPLRLSVAGIPLTLPLEIEGRLALSGRVKRDGFYGGLRAAGRGVWNIIPGVVRMTIAGNGKPATLALYSDGRFALAGAVRLSLFNNAASIEGAVDISQAHVFVEGRLSYQAGSVVDLNLDVQGRFGPGRRFEISGAGSLSILGRDLSAVKATVTERGAAVEGHINTGAWTIAGQAVPLRLSANLAGEISLRSKQKPSFSLEGKGQLNVFGARIDGRTAIQLRSGRVRAIVEGALRWQGRQWLGGRIQLGADGVSIAGRTSFSLNLTPSNLAGIDLAHLYLAINLEGEFTLNSSAGMAGFEISGDWTMAARLPGGSDQVFPMAGQRIRLSGDTTLELELARVSGFVLVPFNGIRIPVPKLRETTPPNPIRYGSIEGDKAMSWNGVAVSFHELGGFPVPTFHFRNLSSGETTVKGYLNFTPGLDWDNAITLDLPVSGDFRLALVWRDKKLAIKVSRGRHVEYHNLESAFG